MLAKLHHNAMEAMAAQMQSKEQRSTNGYDTHGPLEQASASNEVEEESLLILWGDVSILARHPLRINL